AVAAWADRGGTISQPGEPEYVDGRNISAEFFSTLGIIPEPGRAFKREEDRPGAAPVVIISHSLWQRRFGGDPSAIGGALVFEGKPFVIVGVAPAGFQLSGDADVFLPFGQSTDPRLENRAARFLRVIARFSPGVTWGEAQAELTLIGKQLAQQYPISNAGL